jgi:hypothetical protein
MRCFGMVEIAFAPFAQTPNDASEADIIRNVGVTSWAARCRARGVRLQVQGHHGPAIPQGTPSRGGNAMGHPLKIGLFAFAVGLFPVPGSAGEIVEVKALAEVSGLSPRQVCMLPQARTPYAESRFAFDRIEKTFIEAVGESQCRETLAGKPVRFVREIDGRRVACIAQLRSRG